MAVGKKNCYNFSVDMYSLGVVLLDMFRRHDIFHQELSVIHEALKQGKVEESLAKKMEPNVVILIERLISIDPDKRPTIMEVLTSELLP
jgi:serine/threonine protein kinase